jgi:hypothetical protein
MKHEMIEIEPSRQLNEYELVLLQHLLCIDFPGRDQLSQHLLGTTVRYECKYCLTVEFEVSAGYPRAELKRRMPVEAQGLDADGVRIHYLLHTIDGRFAELEVFREDPRDVQRLPEANALRLVGLDTPFSWEDTPVVAF